MNKVQLQDVQEFVRSFSLSDELHGSSFLITGATGLIGSVLVKCLLALEKDIKITVPVRSINKTQSIYGNDIKRLEVVQVTSLGDWALNQEQSFNYIVHCASPTSGKYMEEHPVETFDIAYEVTYNLLQSARKISAKGVVFVSSLEYYGQIFDDRLINESEQGYIDPLSTRSSYPMGKRAGEYLCFAFAKEYGVPAKVARLTQTFGAGISKDDNRVFAQFARSIINGNDIVLHTTGESAKPYCYTTDAVSAILYILLRGEDGSTYNVANEDTYISIKELADYLRTNFNQDVNVRIELNESMGYAPVTRLRLSSQKLMALGWQPRYGLKEMFERLIKSMNYEISEK